MRVSGESLLSYRRASRQRFWLGNIAIFGSTGAIALALMAVGLADVQTVSGVTTFELKPWAWTALAVLVTLAWVVLAVDRRRDRGNPGLDVIAFAAAGLVNQILHAFGIGEGMPLFIFDCLMLAAGLYMLVMLGFLRGTPGPNQYGPDPLSRDAAPARP